MISHTSGRYWYKNGDIYDKFEDKVLRPACDGLYYLPNLGLPFSKGISLEFAFCYSYWSFKGTVKEFESVSYITDSSGTLGPSNIRPYFNLESDIYKGFKYIPCFSNYVVNDDGSVFINVSNGNKLIPHFNLRKSRKEIRLKGDDGSDTCQMSYRMVAFAWLNYKFEDLGKDVDHIDEHKVNDVYTNLQFLSRSDNAKKQNVNKYSRDKFYYVVDLDDKTLTRNVFDKLIDVAKFCETRSSTLLKHLNKVNTNSVLLNRYVVWRKGLDSTPNLSLCLKNRYSSSIGFNVYGTNVKTGETKIFNKVSEILSCPDYQVTKKTLTKDLSIHGKRVFPCGWYFEYEKDKNRPM